MVFTMSTAWQFYFFSAENWKWNFLTHTRTLIPSWNYLKRILCDKIEKQMTNNCLSSPSMHQRTENIIIFIHNLVRIVCHCWNERCARYIPTTPTIVFVFVFVLVLVLALIIYYCSAPLYVSLHTNCANWMDVRCIKWCKHIHTHNSNCVDNRQCVCERRGRKCMREATQLKFPFIWRRQ